MNKLARDQRIQVLTLLCEGMSMRATARATSVSYNTVCALLAQAGEACEAFHDKTVREVRAQRVQCDELWSFCYAKQRNVATAKAAPEGAGDLWTWLGLDADSKLIISFLVGSRDGAAAFEFMQDMAGRLANRVQLTTDGHKAYLEAVEAAFGSDIDYGMLIKAYGEAPHPPGRYSPGICVGATKERIEGKPDLKHISTSYVERQNLNIRMGVRRFTRLTNAFSKSAEAHYHMMALYVVFHNFCRDHKTLRMTPAEAAGLVKSAMTVGGIVDLIAAREAPPKKRGQYKPRQPKVATQPVA
ncbi:MAG TPA: IS1 family transposase [Acetobacteraceae bacterium]|nr:IS1 family transposase [Acetobacteraceae bacterium]